MDRTFGPAYDEELDGKRICKQHEAIRDFIIISGKWWTLAELSRILKYPEASISAQLRHLRKARFGSHKVEKQRRVADKGTWEYKVHPKPVGFIKETLFEGDSYG